MGNIIHLVGPHRAVQLFGVTLVGVNAENGKKLLFSIVFILVISLLGRALRGLARRNTLDQSSKRIALWTRQGISIAVTIVSVVGLISIWFDNPSTLTTAGFGNRRACFRAAESGHRFRRLFLDSSREIV